MENKTEQIQSLNPPDRKYQNIGLMILCGNCKTGRVFRIDETLKGLQNRQNAEFAILTKCEKCGHLLGVGVAWIDATKEGYSYRFFDQQNTKSVVKCKDGMGLAEFRK